MATIDGTTCNITNISMDVLHRNRYLPAVNSYNNTVIDTGYDGLVIAISGKEYTQAEYDTVIAKFMSTGEHLLIVKSGWEYRVHSVKFSPDLIEGIVDNYFPYRLTMISETPYVYSTTDLTRIKTISSNNQEWYEDNSSEDIDTDGYVPAPVYIKITSSATPSSEQATISQTETY